MWAVTCQMHSNCHPAAHRDSINAAIQKDDTTDSAPASGDLQPCQSLCR